QYFTNYNAKKIQSCRRAIAFWSAKGWINGEEKAVMLASLINSLDKVANTAGTYYAFLKKWHRKALNQFRFQFIMPASLNGKGHCFNETAEELVKRRDFDILYLDPPYNQRSYGHYYHLPETIALEGTPVVHGQSGIPIKINTKSKFNNKIESKQALLDVLNNAKFKLLVFHYADNGIIPSKNIEEILSPFGKINDFIIDCKGYRTKISPIKTRHHLYIVKNG
ncbi:MAG: DNA adenine methylase, partial [Proteobacteria bacterium]|nr:DNA adenine methylase [Pseudomonadota bacterium]